MVKSHSNVISVTNFQSQKRGDCAVSRSSCRRSRESPRWLPRYAESGSRASVAVTAARPDDLSPGCAPAWCGSRPRPRSTTRTAVPSSRSNQRACPLASIPTRAFIQWPRNRGRTSPPPSDAAVAALAIPRLSIHKHNLLETRVVATKL